MSSPPASATTAQAYVRIAALSIFAYDYLRTLPAEFRFFKNQRDMGRITFAFVLFLLVRYIGMLAVVFPSLMFFGKFWDHHSCTVMVYFTVYLRCISTTLASIVLARRTWAICRKERILGWVLIGLVTAVAALEFWSQSYHTVSLHSGGCNGNNPHPKIAIIFYAANLAFDLLLAISATVQLWRTMVSAGQWPPFSAFLFKEGIVYLLVVSAVNLLNCVFWSLPTSSGLQSIGATLGVSINAIMAQSVILSLQEALPNVARATGGTHGELPSSQRSRQAQTGNHPGNYHHTNDKAMAFGAPRSPGFMPETHEMGGVATPPRYMSPVQEKFGNNGYPASPVSHPIHIRGPSPGAQQPGYQQRQNSYGSQGNVRVDVVTHTEEDGYQPGSGYRQTRRPPLQDKPSMLSMHSSNEDEEKR